MIKLGVMVLAATVAVLVAEFLRRRSRPFAASGWLGLALLVVAEWLMFRGVRPVAVYFTPIAWTCYLLIVRGAILSMRRRAGSPRAAEPRILEWASLQKMALLSIPLWLIFEAYNLHLANWTYTGLPLSLPARWLGYAWSFATITPAILLTAEMVESFGWWSGRARPIRFTEAVRRVWIIIGAGLLLIPLLLPRWLAAYTFGLVWLGFIFLLDPINFRLGFPSVLGDLEEGRRSRLFSLVASGWVCGWLWEFWNYWASAQWVYIFPMFQGVKIFEMPVPGYIGFMPFAVECFVMYSSASGVLGWRGHAVSSNYNAERA